MDVKSAGRTLDLFETFSDLKTSLTLTDLSRQLQWPASSCFALVRTLEARGYIYEVSARRGFYPTRRILDRAMVISANDPISEMTNEVLTHLRDATNETVILGRLQSNQVVYLNVIEPRQSIRYSARVGDLKPLHASAMGKALLGALPHLERDKALDAIELKRVTSATITNRRKLIAHVEEGQARGWQLTRSENVSDVMAVARSVKLAGDRYAVAIAGPVHRMDASIDRHVKALLSACAQLERDR
jgi:DNA-binding IclR family transcriptional regulator